MPLNVWIQVKVLCLPTHTSTCRLFNTSVFPVFLCEMKLELGDYHSLKGCCSGIVDFITLPERVTIPDDKCCSLYIGSSLYIKPGKMCKESAVPDHPDVGRWCKQCKSYQPLGNFPAGRRQYTCKRHCSNGNKARYMIGYCGSEVIECLLRHH